MPQPVKKKIEEIHSDKIKEPDFRTLLIDGNSLLFMCMRDEKVNTEGQHYGGVFQFLLQLRLLLGKADFKFIYCFFDDEFSGLLRYNIYKHYKANRDNKHYAEYATSDYMREYNERLRTMQNAIFGKNKSKASGTKTQWEKLIDENFNRERDIICLMLNELFIRWNTDEVTEGDDQIAYYCKNKKPNEKIYIVSGDMDITQLISDDICVYNLHKKKFIHKGNFKETFGYHYENVAVKKILCGDVSDNIGNIKGLSENGLYEIMPELKNRKVSIDEVKSRVSELCKTRKNEKKKPLKLHENILNGVSNKEYDGDFYEINRKLVDLSEPIMSEEARETMDAMMYAPLDPEGRNMKNLYRIILENGIDELKGDTKFASFFSPFKRIEENERNFLKEK